MHRSFVALALAGAIGAASAQYIPMPQADWKEVEAPPPPALSTRGLIPLEITGSSLRFGVDPASVTVAGDGVVRYVVVATSSSGTTNAMYEGIRCSSGEVKVYARHNPDSGWVPLRNAEWQPLQNRPNSRHSLTVARTGACIGQGPSGSASEIVRALRTGPDMRFQPR